MALLATGGGSFDDYDDDSDALQHRESAAVLSADLSITTAGLGENSTADSECVLLACDEAEVKPTRSISTEAPRRVVRFPWGDVPTPWVGGYSTVYDSCIDDAVFALFDEMVCTSLDDDDDPSWEQAIRGNESQQWYAAADVEYDNLSRFEVFELWPADKVPLDEDIFDTMFVCKRKRGRDNKITKHKIRNVL